MSVKIMGSVWDLDLPPKEKLLLMALADHASHDGSDVYPSLSRLAYKTQYSVRTVRRYMRKLEERGLLVKEEARPGRTTVYRIDISAGVMRNYKSKQTGVNKNPGQSCDRPEKEALTPDKAVTATPDKAVTATPDKAVTAESSVPIKDPSSDTRTSDTDPTGKIIEMPIDDDDTEEQTRTADMAQVFTHYKNVFGSTMSKTMADDVKDWCDEYGAALVIAAMDDTKKFAGRYVPNYMQKVIDTKATEAAADQAKAATEQKKQSARDARGALNEAAALHWVLGESA
jgi:DNA-binding Lrp family transcriptional regulator